LVAIPLMASAQSKKDQPVLRDIKEVYYTGDEQKPSTVKAETGNGQLNKAVVIDYVKVGATVYDLQTNASIGRRVLLHGDGTISVVWTTAPSGNVTDGFPPRGTGYNYYNGTSWMSPVTVRLEPSADVYRTGWPSIGILGNGNEYVIGHKADSGGFRMSQNTGKGTTNWSTGPVILDEANGKPIWGRAANIGNTIHLIANYSDTGAEVRKVNGVSNPMVYSRSTDGGNSWDKQHIMLPGYDSTQYLNGGGDNYAIDAKGNTVVIALGGITDHVTIWKSIDNGDNFTRMLADSFPFAPYAGKALITDTIWTNDGSVEVLIDNSGQVHAWWGSFKMFDPDTTNNSTYSYFPRTNGLKYWNENQKTVMDIGSVYDIDQNLAVDIFPATYARNKDFNANPPINSAAQYGQTSLATMPSASIDGNGNIFCVFSAPIEGDVNIDNENFRDIWINHTTNGGTSWGTQQNVTKSIAKEDVFAAVAKSANSFVHMIYQADPNPGTELQNADDPGSNDINYMAIPVSDILSGAIGVGQEAIGIADPQVSIVSQNYPNPFDNETNVVITLNTSSDVSLRVSDMLGKSVQSYELGKMSAGTHSLVIEGAGLKPGVYFYTVQAGNSVSSRKMVVK
jgi:hypothetical protein